MFGSTREIEEGIRKTLFGSIGTVLLNSALSKSIILLYGCQNWIIG